MSPVLPTEFSDLEIFVDWALPTQATRLSKRLSSSMEEIMVFYNALVPRIEAILAYLEKYQLDGVLPKEAEKLRDMAFSLAMVGPAVEMFKQPAVVCGFDARKFLSTHEPTSTRPSMSIARKALV